MYSTCTLLYPRDKLTELLTTILNIIISHDGNRDTVHVHAL